MNFKPARLSLLAIKFGFGSAVIASVMLAGCATTQTPAQTRFPTTQAPQRPVVPAPQAPQQLPQQTPQSSESAQTPNGSPQEPKQQETSLQAQAPQSFTRRDGLTPPHMAGREINRVAIVLPFSDRRAGVREEAASMLKAAEMAVFDRAEADTLLIALDSQGTTAGAKAATEAAVRSGAASILGPLLAANVKESARAASKSGTPLLAFSTDQSVAGNGVFLLSFPPEAEVKRVTEFAAREGALKFAFLGPDSTYGRRVKDAYQSTAEGLGAQLSDQETYSGNDITVMQEPASRMATRYREAYELGETSFDAVLLPEGGTALRSLAPLLTYYEGRTANAMVLGTGLWNREDVAQEPALRGGVFAGPDLQGKSQFEDSYENSFQTEASRLASLAYDGLNIASDISGGDPRGRSQRLSDPRGFYGVDGFIRFRADGTPERGLAIYEVGPGRFILVDPAPKTAEELILTQ